VATPITPTNRTRSAHSITCSRPFGSPGPLRAVKLRAQQLPPPACFFLWGAPSPAPCRISRRFARRAIGARNVLRRALEQRDFPAHAKARPARWPTPGLSPQAFSPASLVIAILPSPALCWTSKWPPTLPHKATAAFWCNRVRLRENQQRHGHARTVARIRGATHVFFAFVVHQGFRRSLCSVGVGKVSPAGALIGDDRGAG
jgi:hypothetical protein